MYSWLEKSIYGNLLAESSSINAFNKPVGMFRVRSFRSKSRSCDVSINLAEYKCYDSLLIPQNSEKSQLVPNATVVKTQWVNYE